MKRIIGLISVLAVCLGCVPAVIAYEEGDPCLLYGYDPDTRDDYETYGDEVFLKAAPLKSPTGDLFITLNAYASKRIMTEAKSLEDFNRIVSKDYFPELDIYWIYRNSFVREDTFESEKKAFIEQGKELYVSIQLKDNSKEAVREALVALASRCEIDIKDVIYISYDLKDVANALKIIAGWCDIPSTVLYNYNGSYNNSHGIDLTDVTVMLKAIAGWKNDGWYWKTRGYGEIIDNLY